MIDHPVFKPTFAVEVIEPEGVYLLSEQGHFVLKGELYCALAPLLDGTRSADDLVDTLADEASAAEVYYALSLMEARGYTVEAAPEIPPERAAFWHAAGMEPALAEQRLQQTPVSIVTLGAVSAEPFAEALAAMGLRLAADGAFTVVLTDDYLQEGLTEFNAAALASGSPWLLVRPLGTQIWVGPVFVPGTTACWECLAQRLQANREVERYVLGRLQRTAPLPVARASSAAGLALAGELAALEAAKAIGKGLASAAGAPRAFRQDMGTNTLTAALSQRERENTALPETAADSVGRGLVPRRPEPAPGAPAEGAGESPALPENAASLSQNWERAGVRARADAAIVTLDTLTLETTRHTVIRRPQCTACGEAADPYERQPLPVQLLAQPVRFTADGGHRTVSPEQTVAQYERQVSPISGAVSSLVRTPVPGSEGLHVYTAGHNFAMKADSLYFLRRGLRSKSAGKGVSDAQAKASALGEAIERYSGIFQGDEPRRRASYRSLGRTAIHPNACMLFSNAQYAARAELNAGTGRFNHVADPFDEEEIVDWTPVWSLSEQTFKYLPTAYCYFGYPLPPGHVFSRGDSNGNASGNTLEEALLQGFFELVERDAVALWWYNRLQRPGVDLDSFGESYLAQVREEYRRLDRELWVLDLTNDLGIPVFAALSRRVDQPSEQILMGFGAHFDPRIALLRAVTEMNQMLSFGGAVDRESSDLDDPDTVHWLRTATIANQPYVAPSAAPARRRTGFADLSSGDIAEDVLRCRQIVEARGMEMLVLDQTRPDIGLPVAKVTVPGLRHFWSRFAPGRLYDVPVQLGWLPEPLAEDQLNPMPMFL